MDELLQRLRQEGRQDDSGNFTLNPERAREVMAQYQSASPERYPLMFVAAACRLRASGLTLTDESCFQLEDAVLKPSEIEGLFCHLLTDGPLRYLGMGMLMAEKLEASWVKLSCGGTQLTLKQGKTLVEKAIPGPLRIEVRGKRHWFRSGKVPMAPGRVLRNWARLSPIPITIDGAQLERAYRPREPLLGTLVVGDLPVNAPGLVERLPSPGDYRAALTVGSPGNKETGTNQDVPMPGQVWCVVDGVTYSAPGLLPYWVRGVIDTPLARPDLTLSSIVQTEPIKALASELLDLLAGLIDTLADERNPEAADEIRSYAAWRGGPLGVRLLNKVLEFPGLSDDVLSLTLMQTAEMEAKCELAEAAEAHLRRALELIRERPRRIEALFRLGQLLRAREAPDEEHVGVMSELLRLLDKVGRSDSRTMEVLEVLAKRAEGEEARTYNKRLLDARESVQGSNHPDLAPILNRLARLCARSSPLDAEHYRQRSLEIWSYNQGRGCEEPPDQR